MYNRIDKNGFYLGISSDSKEGMEFYTETAIVGDFVKFKCEKDIWVEGASEEEIAESKALLESVKAEDLREKVLRLENELAEIKAGL